MNPQELFIDVSSGRFLDGESTIAVAKPNFFGDEKRSVKLAVLKVKNNRVSAVTPSENSRYKMRLGTTALKLSDATDTPTAPAVLYTAQATIVTAPASQATGLGVLLNYTPVTAQFDAIVSTQSAVTAIFESKINRVSPITAAITVGISATTQQVQAFSGKITTSDTPLSRIMLAGAIRPPGWLRTLELIASLNSTNSAIFNTTVTNGTVTCIGISVAGNGYPNGTYAISFSGASTAGTITASANAVASGGKVISVSLTDGGSGYSGAPSATLFTPEKQISKIDADTSKVYNAVRQGPINGKPAFRWAEGSSAVSVPKIPLNFSAPDATSTTIPTSVPSAFLVFDKEDTWYVDIISNGYGYVNVPSVTHDTAIVGAPAIVFSDDNGVKSTIDRTRTMTLENGGAALSYYNSFGGADYSIFDFLFNLSTAQGNLAFISFPYKFGSGEPFGPFSELNPLDAESSGAKKNNITSRGGTFLQGQTEALLNQELFGLANSNVFIVGAQSISQGSDRRHPIWSLEIPSIKQERFKILQRTIRATGPGTILDYRYDLPPIDTELNKGGIFNAQLKYIDAGTLHARDLKTFLPIKNADVGASILETPVAVNASIPTALFPFYNTIYSIPPTVATRQGISFTDYYLDFGGFGLGGNGIVNFTGVTQTTGGIVVTASLANTPIPYLDGTYSCEVQSPSVGTRASIDFVVLGGRGRVVINDGGAGYTSKPIVTAPIPNGINGTISSLKLTNSPVGYKFNVPYKLSIAPSGVTGGNVEATFTIVTARLTEDTALTTNPISGISYYARNLQGGLPSGAQIIQQVLVSDNTSRGLGRKVYTQTGAIINRSSNGFGYVTAPAVTAPAPDSDDIGKIIGLILKNSPKGYIPNKEYNLEIEASPNIAGSCVASFSVSEAGILNTSIQAQGFGYTSKPVVTAPSPDQKQGIVTNAKKTFSGAGYAPGTYKCDVAEAPSGGETAQVSFIVSESGASQFSIDSAGYGYTTAPIVTAPLQPGNIVKSITITCQGSYYDSSTATFSIIDSSGFGAVAGTPLLFSGKINNIQILNSGYGYSSVPIIEFGAPTEPIITDIEASRVQGDFNITTASANAILTTANQRDILLEVYETDGTNEQVVAQGTVNLAKRVLE